MSDVRFLYDLLSAYSTYARPTLPRCAQLPLPGEGASGGVLLVSSFRAKSRNLSCTALICSDARIGNRCLIALLFSCPMEVVSLGMTNGEALTP